MACQWCITYKRIIICGLNLLFHFRFIKQAYVQKAISLIKRNHFTNKVLELLNWIQSIIHTPLWFFKTFFTFKHFNLVVPGWWIQVEAFPQWDTCKSHVSHRFVKTGNKRWCIWNKTILWLSSKTFCSMTKSMMNLFKNHPLGTS